MSTREGAGLADHLDEAALAALLRRTLRVVVAGQVLGGAGLAARSTVGSRCSRSSCSTATATARPGTPSR